jgi:predicted house-cleaning noncanonical NTP pyrophosphatase (MazG superfamily)
MKEVSPSQNSHFDISGTEFEVFRNSILSKYKEEFRNLSESKREEIVAKSFEVIFNLIYRGLKQSKLSTQERQLFLKILILPKKFKSRKLRKRQLEKHSQPQSS